MSSAPLRRLLTYTAILTTLASGNSAYAAADQGLRAPHLKPDPTTAEAGLWDLSDKAESHVKASGERARDPALESYVRGVICKVATEYCEDLRVYVLDRPFLNAAAAPNGYIEVNSGLLLRAQTEDELAFVLGHEVSHFARNHTIERWRTMRGTANATLVLQIGVAVVAAGAMYSAAGSGSPNAGSTINSISQAAQSLNDLIYLSGLAAIYGYSRDQEAEADRLGYGRALAAGYERGGGAAMWADVLAETQASDFVKVRKSESRASIFNTHPLTADRIAALQAMAGAAPGDRDLAARRRYREHVRAHLGEWLKDDLRRRDFGQTLHIIDRLEVAGEDLGVLEFYRGEAYRQRRQDGDATLALKAYGAAVAHADAPPAAWRELGEAARKAGDAPGARVAFESYLAHAPAAQDRWLVEASLKTLQPAGTP